MENTTARLVRLAYFVSHPIQYQAPLLRRIAREQGIDLVVFFFSDFSVRNYRDTGFGADVKWDVDLLGGYEHRFIATSDKPHVSIRKIFGELRRGRFDAVWVHGYSTAASLKTIAAAKALGIPVLLRAESWLGDRPRSKKTLFLKRIYLGVIKHLVDATLAIGTHNRLYWQKYFGESFPIVTVPYAVDNEYFETRTAKAAPQRESLRAELQIAPGHPILLFASKLQQRKQCDMLLEAFLRLEITPAPYLVIVGDGEQRAALEERVAQSGTGNVRFAGFRNQSELPAFFYLSDVFILPSRYEPWGLIVNEAMNAALPVIVSDEVGSAADLVEDGVTGFVFPATSLEGLFAALNRALANPGATAQVGENALRRIRTWDFEADVAGLHTALDHVLGVPAKEHTA